MRSMVGSIISSIVALLLCPIILWDSAFLWGRFHDAWVLFVPWLAWCMASGLHGTSFLICSYPVSITGWYSGQIRHFLVVSVAFFGSDLNSPPSELPKGKTACPKWTLPMHATTTNNAGYIRVLLFPYTRSLKPWMWKLLQHIVILKISQMSFYRDHSCHIIKYAPC